MRAFIAASTARIATDFINVNKNTASYYFQRLRLTGQKSPEMANTAAGELYLEIEFKPHSITGQMVIMFNLIYRPPPPEKPLCG